MGANTAEQRSSGLLLPVLVLFFVSGATGLLYELLWMRRLTLVFGATHLAVATVLAAFMLGLALGAAWSGRIADTWERPLLLYGLLELFIGAYALVFPALVDLSTGLYREVFAQGEPGRFWQFQLFHLAVMVAVLTLPTAAMGATFPLLSRFVSERLSKVGRRAGLLYAFNTAGAVLGTGLCGLVLLPALGVRTTEVAAALANIAVGLVALQWSRSRDGLHEEVEDDLQEQREHVEFLELAPDPNLDLAARRRLRPIVLSVLALSGACAMVYEVAWTRFLTLLLGSSVYAFTLMLIAFLLGTAGGATMASSHLGRPGVRPLAWLAAGLAGAGVTAWMTNHLFRFMPYWYVDLFGLIGGNEVMLFVVHGALAMLVMVPTTLCIGSLFPFALHLLADSAPRVGRDVSTLYVVNTLGAVVGALLAGFVLVPLHGIQNALAWAIALDLILAVVVLQRYVAPPRPRRLAQAGVLVLLAASLWIRPPWDPLLMSAGMYKYVSELSDYSHEALRNYAFSDYELLYYGEGIASVVTVARSRGTGNIWLANNGKVDASTKDDLRTQVLLAHLPFLYRPDAQQALVVGLASGITAGSVMLQEGLVGVDVLEIEPRVIEASHFFDEVNGRPLEDPRVRAIANDARNHLHRHSQRYDVIINEPSNPWISGVSNLFTRDFLELGRERLTDEGVFVQWTHTYGMASRDLRSVVGTFAQVYPHVLVFSTIEDADVILLGSRSPLQVGPAQLASYLARPAVQGDLSRIGVQSPYDLLSFLLMDRPAALDFAGDAPVNTDDNAHLEFSAPLYLHYATQQSNAEHLLAARAPFLELRAGGSETEEEYLLEMGAVFERGGRWQEARDCYLEALELDPRSLELRGLLERLVERSAGE